MFSQFEIQTMKMLIEKARLSKGLTGHNPMVGAAIIKNDVIISEGIHLKEGGDHAEVIAIANAGDDANGASILVTLEPCTHFGKTPPCNKAIIEAGIKKVIYAVKDPNPKVSQSPGDDQLRVAGIEVLSGCLEKEALDLNEVFFKRHLNKSPFVTLKMAQSQDNKIAINDGTTMYITSKESLIEVHRLRRQADAILVGIGTVLSDNPVLNIRHGLLESGYKNPIKLILDSHLRTPLDAKIIKENTDTKVIIFTQKNRDVKKIFPSHVVIVPIENKGNSLSLSDVLAYCFEHGIFDIFVEGGPAIYESFLNEKLADKAIVFKAPSTGKSTDVKSPFIVNDNSECLNLRKTSNTLLANDICITGTIIYD
jgi:diaminohydroxyphosphoribosylaminopyrimidine deaminase / 5-amino-6-(5-phosphoribosylamino)uracil reductase